MWNGVAPVIYLGALALSDSKIIPTWSTTQGRVSYPSLTFLFLSQICVYSKEIGIREKSRSPRCLSHLDLDIKLLFKRSVFMKSELLHFRSFFCFYLPNYWLKQRIHSLFSPHFLLFFFFSFTPLGTHKWYSCRRANQSFLTTCGGIFPPEFQHRTVYYSFLLYLWTAWEVLDLHWCPWGAILIKLSVLLCFLKWTFRSALLRLTPLLLLGEGTRAKPAWLFNPTWVGRADNIKNQNKAKFEITNAERAWI